MNITELSNYIKKLLNLDSRKDVYVVPNRHTVDIGLIGTSYQQEESKFSIQFVFRTFLLNKDEEMGKFNLLYYSSKSDFVEDEEGVFIVDEFFIKRLELILYVSRTLNLEISTKIEKALLDFNDQAKKG